MSPKNRIIMLVFGILLFSAFFGTASATTWYVDDDGGADFTHIQDAFDNASAGDTIIVILVLIMRTSS